MMGNQNERDVLERLSDRAYFSQLRINRAWNEIEAIITNGAAEITRLRTALAASAAQSGGSGGEAQGPVAWRWRFDPDHAWYYGTERPGKFRFSEDQPDIEPLYTHPDPRAASVRAEGVNPDAPELRASLRSVADSLAALLEAGKFPTKGRSQDDKDSTQGWWEDRIIEIQRAYAALAQVSVEEWQAAHPGLFIPPHGLVALQTPHASGEDQT